MPTLSFASVRRQTEYLREHFPESIARARFLVAAASVPLAQASLTRERVDPAGTNHRHVIIGPSDGRVAAIGNIGSRKRARLDGVRGPRFAQAFRPSYQAQAENAPQLPENILQAKQAGPRTVVAARACFANPNRSSEAETNLSPWVRSQPRLSSEYKRSA